MPYKTCLRAWGQISVLEGQLVPSCQTGSLHLIPISLKVVLGGEPLCGFPHASLMFKHWCLVQKSKKMIPFLAGGQPLGSSVPWVDRESMLPAGLLLVSLQVK